MKKQETTHNRRPIMKPGRLWPSPWKSTSQVAFAHDDLLRSSSVILATAKKAICIPSSIPTTDIKPKKRMTAITFGTCSHMVVLPSKSATRVATIQKVRIAKEKRIRAQKKRDCAG